MTNNYREKLISSIALSTLLLIVFIITWDCLLILSRWNNATISSSFDGGAVDNIARDLEFNVDKGIVVLAIKADRNKQSQNQNSSLEHRNKDSQNQNSSSDHPKKDPQNQNSSSQNQNLSSVHPNKESQNQNSSSDGSECDLYHGEWFYDPVGPLYTNNTCPIISQIPYNCQGNRRPDKEYENWRWKPYNCQLPRFNSTKFFELMRGKTITFVGDSLARNQFESLMCMLWQVETPINRGYEGMARWIFKDKNVTILRFWSSWLVHTKPSKDITKIFLDVPDTTFMEHASKSDMVIFTNGHWFTKRAIYSINNEIVGGQKWTPPDNKPLKLNITTSEAFELSTETALTALATHPSYSGLTIVTTFSPYHHYNESGGSCIGKVRPILPGKIVEHEYTNAMHDKQVSGFYRAIKKKTNKSKMKLMDITEAFKYRHDGHPGPYGTPKITQMGSLDCSHWCLPGPVDVWNEIMLEIIRREFEQK